MLKGTNGVEMIGFDNLSIKQKANQRGITILEALVSTAIIGIGFVAVFQMVQYSIRSIDVSGERTKMNYLVGMVAEDIISDKDNFIVNDPQKDINGNFRTISVKPIDVSKFAHEFFDTEYQIFMSATIDHSSFCENMGLEKDDVAFVDTPKSPFAIEHREINLMNIRRLSYGSTEEDELEVIKTIDRILDEHSDERGLILTSSIPRCQKIIRYLSPKNTKRIRLCHSKNKSYWEYSKNFKIYPNIC